MADDLTERIPLIFEFHIAGKVRKKYQVSDALFATDGRVVFANPLSVRQLAYQMNQHRPPVQHVFPGELNAAGLLEEAFHLVLRQYEERVNLFVFEKAHEYLVEKMGAEKLRRVLIDFTLQFPPQRVFQGTITATGYLSAISGNRKNATIVLEELLMVLLANLNPATLKFRELFDRKHLDNQSLIDGLLHALETFFASQPPLGPGHPDILTFLKSPFLAAPEDIYAQLEYVLLRWKEFLPEKFLVRLLQGRDLMKEDFLPLGTMGSETTIAPRYKGQAVEGAFIGKSGYDYGHESAKDYEEGKAFTPDLHWMPRVVMIAKNTQVWLDQLSNTYQRDIRQLDQIPDEELDRLARWNINGLWLIGIWERSSASKRIKHITGFTDAVSSAYSLYDYQIAGNLGGEEAYHNLNHRARQRGIRLASDMVPNHTGIFSKWVVENPDYFIQTRVPPFPGYRFTGENLSEHPEIEIRIEDGYYSKTDAAVVFQRIDRRHNDVRYLYHGNDGTNMPWNDTAQLDMLKKEVREAVIQMIFGVARRFSIIRFDAAMTLAKKHFARLWYPQPGTGGDIPSRSDYSMSREAFDSYFPIEFWREVVDRINTELPETLLLAEAFWLMEGYFVRTLGMHRVYNSAFMHMLKNEENEKYRDLITNTLEFEPEILKRYVNFMSNPDEETAMKQFGSGDKYFGVCVMMCTLPGLPMFAHGQIEAFTEKYGMEYQRAYYNELPQPWHIERHEREIFPLLSKRYLFSEVEHFNFFDFIHESGTVNESVLAFTNRLGQERALVLFNNRYEVAKGFIHNSCPKLDSDGNLNSFNLADLLGLRVDQNQFYIVSEHVSGLEYLISGLETGNNGFYRSLQGYEYRVFWNFREVYDISGTYARLYQNLQGQGVKSIGRKVNLLEFELIYTPFKQILHPTSIEQFLKGFLESDKLSHDQLVENHFLIHFRELAENIISRFGLSVTLDPAIDAFRKYLNAVHEAYLFASQNCGKISDVNKLTETDQSTLNPLPGTKGLYRRSVLLIVALYAQKALSKLDIETPLHQNRLEPLHLAYPLEEILMNNGLSVSDIENDLLLLEILLEQMPEAPELSHVLHSPGKQQDNFQQHKEYFSFHLKSIHNLLNEYKVQQFIRVHHFNNTSYYSKEQFEELLEWMFANAFFEFFYSGNQNTTYADPKKVVGFLTEGQQLLAYLKEVSHGCGYQFDKLIFRLQQNIEA